MNCRRIEELIPLYVEGDLDERSTADVRSHLQGCIGCSALADEYEASQAWLHSYEPPDFDDSFVDGIRLNVMGEIAKPDGKTSFVDRLTMWLTPRRVASAAIALIVAIIALSLLVYSKRSSDHHEIATTGTQPALEVKNGSDSENPKTPVKQAIVSPKRHRVAPLPVKYFRRKANRLGTRPDHDIAQQSPPAVNPDEPINGSEVESGSKEMLRIELQTADPNIRIIWFAPKQSGDTSKPLNETR
jgi:hypothetical protein